MTECKVCGHKAGYGWVDDKYVKLEGEDFINIEGNFSYSTRYTDNKKCYLYACPKCGTVRMED